MGNWPKHLFFYPVTTSQHAPLLTAQAERTSGELLGLFTRCYAKLFGAHNWLVYSNYISSLIVSINFDTYFFRPRKPNISKAKTGSIKQDKHQKQCLFARHLRHMELSHEKNMKEKLQRHPLPVSLP